jgi:type I restriction-modification system DNA methylase subunit
MPPRRRKKPHPSKSLFAEQTSAILLTDFPSIREEAAPLCDLAKRQDPYKRFYAALGVLRKDFHRIGRFDDANAKLDELCKLLVLKVLDERHPIAGKVSRLGSAYLHDLAKTNHGNETRLALALHDVYREIAEQFPEEMLSFGSRNGLNISPDDDEFAAALLPLFDALPQTHDLDNGRWSFDGVNEAFGHFIQDSFRNRKEDAQYMTPPEVVSSIVDIAIQDLLNDLDRRTPGEPFVVADPTCGVGSFLAAMFRHALHTPVGDGYLSDHLQLVGQDKVERMVRLACVNLKIFAGVNAIIRQGNSVLPASTLADLQDKVDLVITNPPFGATFETQQLLKHTSRKQLPTLHDLADKKALPKAIDSEYILLDREMSLLKTGGRLLMVVPDHVVSTGGFAETFRLALLQSADLIAVFDLPTETFAQAGTRTKTSVIYLQRKTNKSTESRPGHVFMATSEDLGFRVVSRAGATVKRIVGNNDMDTIATIYREFRQSPQPTVDITCLCQHPSVAAVAGDRLLNNRWTAGFYQTERLRALQRIETNCSGDFAQKRLLDLVTIDPESRERILANETNRCISVLHVREDGCVDLRAVDSYRPTTPGSRCRPGDVLLSKINPRIPRLCVVPEASWDFGCSAEFAVLRPGPSRISAWALLLLLRSDAVQAQIRTLTSGTSSSHNRIKDRDLATIVIPVPLPGSTAAVALDKASRMLEEGTMQHYIAAAKMHDCLQEVRFLLGELS